MIDPVLIALPGQIETARLLMRPPQAGDGSLLLPAATESLAELQRFLSSAAWMAHEQTLESAEIYCRKAHANFVARKDLSFLLIEKVTGQVVGEAGLHRIEWATPKVEIGYWGRTSRTRHGFVSEAVEALCVYAFDHLRAVRVELITVEDNERSRRLAERCNFELEGILRNERRAPGGELRNACIYARFPPAP
ncbi:GNAT family N-acetyltransferase [Caenimonas sp. SL110]|uniref:GNAT family N-acetyltransferase n=1 Tax=Caenimonas sp. SL110 TaxID=1450524 RepID=UPI00065294C7|nr:GNAT family N-acetyltransferase [Caenimonas sp. SL110]